MDLQELLDKEDLELVDMLVFTAIDNDSLKLVLDDLMIDISEEDYLNMLDELYQEILKRF